MHRFYCASLKPSQEQVVIDDKDECRHITRVLRLKPGDEMELVNGRGVLARARLRVVSGRGVEAEILECRELPRTDRPKVILACALPKRSKFDDIVEKSTELGVDEVVPLVTERTEAVPSQTAAGRMAARFKTVVISASKQCKRLWFPVIHPVMKFRPAVDMFAKDGSALFIPWLEGERQLLKDVITPGPAARVFFIGPEGDFTPDEAAYAISKGAVPVSLGDTVLRVETAAVAVAAYTRLACANKE